MQNAVNINKFVCVNISNKQELFMASIPWIVITSNETFWYSRIFECHKIRDLFECQFQWIELNIKQAFYCSRKIARCYEIAVHINKQAERKYADRTWNTTLENEAESSSACSVAMATICRYCYASVSKATSVGANGLWSVTPTQTCRRQNR